MSDNTSSESSEKELTLKQRKWLDVYLSTGNATEAAMQSYDCKDRESASQIGYENLRKLDYIDFLEAAGVTDKLLQEKLLEGLESTKPISALVLVSGDKPMRTRDNEGQIEVPDYAIRHKYLETALKLKQKLIERKDFTSKGEKIEGNQIIFTDFKNDTKGQSSI